MLITADDENALIVDDPAIAPTGSRLYLEPWCRVVDSCVSGFATARPAGRAVPAPSCPCGPQGPAVHLDRWEVLERQERLPATVHVVELGPTDGRRARCWLDRLDALARARGSDLHQRVVYTLCGPSADVLAGAVVGAGHPGRVQAVRFEPAAVTPMPTLPDRAVMVVLAPGPRHGSLREEIVRIDGCTYRTEARAYLVGSTGRAVADQLGVPVTVLPGLIEKQVRRGARGVVDGLPTLDAACRRAVRAGLRLALRYVAVDLARFEIAPGVPGLVMSSVLGRRDGEPVRIDVAVVAGLARLRDRLHPDAVVEVDDPAVAAVAGACGYRVARGATTEAGSVGCLAGGS